jgi:hypothetical protein
LHAQRFGQKMQNPATDGNGQSDSVRFLFLPTYVLASLSVRGQQTLARHIA